MFFGWEQVEKAQALNLLKQIKELFANHNSWIYWPLAVDISNNEVSPSSKEAIKWSFNGRL